MTSFLPQVGDLTPEQRAVYDMLPIDLTRGLLLTRSSAVPYLLLGRSSHDGRLPARVRELIILRVGAVTETTYEVFHHVPEARACGVPEETIDKVLAGSPTVGNEELDVLMAFVDQLVDKAHNIRPRVRNVQKYYSHNEIAEIVLLVGHYVMTSLFIKVLDIQSEETPVSPSTWANADAPSEDHTEEN